MKVYGFWSEACKMFGQEIPERVICYYSAVCYGDALRTFQEAYPKKDMRKIIVTSDKSISEYERLLGNRR